MIVVNYAVGPTWGVPVYGSPLIHTGGNYMCDGHGNGFSTDLVYDENPSLTEPRSTATCRAISASSTYHVDPGHRSSGIHHIDCWAKLLNEETILVKQVATSNRDLRAHASRTRWPP